MKTLTIIKIMTCLLPLIPNSADALVSREYVQWSKGQFELPPEIKEVTDISELRSLLDKEHEFTRMAAVRRLGEIEGAKSVGPLTEIFRREPLKKKGVKKSFPLVKLEVIRTLGRIETEQAKLALSGILKYLWKRGRNVKDTKEFRFDRDFAPVMPLLLETLSKWSGDDDIFEMARTIALSEAIKEFCEGEESIGQKAWEIYLHCKTIKEGIVEEKDSATYLLDFMEHVPEPIRYGTLGLAKQRAANAVLKKTSNACLISLIEEYEIQHQEEPRDPKGFFTERHKTLKRRIGYLKKLVREKEKEGPKNQEEDGIAKPQTMN